jgi:monoamine oxidase
MKIPRRTALSLLPATMLASRVAVAGGHPRVVVIGAGIAGLSAVRDLAEAGLNIIVVEARDRIGGRIWTSNDWPDLPVDLGASSIHGVSGNPINTLADALGAERMPTEHAVLRAYGPQGELAEDPAAEADRGRPYRRRGC